MDYLSSLHEDTHEVTSVDNELSTPVSASTEARQIMNGVHNQLKGATVWMAKSSLSPSPACGASWSTTTPPRRSWEPCPPHVGNSWCGTAPSMSRRPCAGCDSRSSARSLRPKRRHGAARGKVPE